MNDILRMVTKQEELLRFDSFSNDDAFALGCLLLRLFPGGSGTGKDTD